MIKIIIPVSAKDKIPEINQFMNREILYTPDLNGEEFEIETDIDAQCAYLECTDNYSAVRLTRVINDIVLSHY